MKKTEQIYTRIWDKTNHPIGVLLATRRDNTRIEIGWSLTHKNDKFDIVTGLNTARDRYYRDDVPEKIRMEYDAFVVRCKKYFQDDIVCYNGMWKHVDPIGIPFSHLYSPETPVGVYKTIGNRNPESRFVVVSDLEHKTNIVLYTTTGEAPSIQTPYESIWNKHRVILCEDEIAKNFTIVKKTNY